ncbi:hypothetical protein Adt_15207 [Abeliophyllum distichum]|uniref:Uncharacterized protein n=1 Tax=Abeliophyllum distichum TaxID=126358 RepID=A0ABD1U2Y1_9LAMI
MSTGVVEEDVTGRSGEEASSTISPSMECVLPIRGVDANTGEVVVIPTTSLRGAEDPYRADVVRWAALEVPSIMVAEDMRLLRDAYRIPSDIEILLPDPNERACFLRMGCTVLYMNAFRDYRSASVYLPSPPATRRYGFILNRHRCLIELGLMTMDKEKRPRPALARLNKQKPMALVAGSPEEA